MSDVATKLALDSLDALSEAWAQEVSLTKMVGAIAIKDDRESRIEALVKQAFVEGAYRMFCQAKDDGMLKLPENDAE